MSIVIAKLRTKFTSWRAFAVDAALLGNDRLVPEDWLASMPVEGATILREAIFDDSRPARQLVARRQLNGIWPNDPDNNAHPEVLELHMEFVLSERASGRIPASSKAPLPPVIKLALRVLEMAQERSGTHVRMRRTMSAHVLEAHIDCDWHELSTVPESLVESFVRAMELLEGVGPRRYAEAYAPEIEVPKHIAIARLDEFVVHLDPLPTTSHLTPNP